MNASRWTSFHVHLFRDPREIDLFLTNEISPLLDAERESGAICRWYFLRYWTGGPHLRLRVENANYATVERIRTRLAMAAYTDTPNRAINAETYFASFGASGSDGRLQTDGDVMLAEYQPETERYGGVQAIAAAETVFVESAEIARAVIESTHGKINQRHAIAADLVLVFAHAMGFSAPDTLQQVRNYFYGWDISTETTPVRPRWLVAAARSAFAQNPDYWAARWDLLAAKLADAAEDAYTLWGMAIRRFRQTLENLDLQPAAINRATWSQQHMLMNRLGVSVLDERKIMWLIGLGIEARLRMRIDSAIAGDAYLATTRSPRIMDHCNPILDVDQFTRNHELISLQPTEIRTEVYTTLLTRRSRTSGYRASLTFEKLGNLFAGLTGPSGRTYPSPGAMYPTELHVYSRGMPGLPQGTYRSNVEAGTLEPTNAFLDDDDLEAASPYLRFAHPTETVDMSGAQLVLFLVTNFGQLRPKYQELSLKLALLDAGHLSQTVLTLATGLGMASLVVAGFDDDVLNAALRLDGFERFVTQIIVLGDAEPTMVQ